MGKITKVFPHLSTEAIQGKIRETVGFWMVRRWLILLHAQESPSTAEEIAKRLGVGKQTVSNLVSSYNRYGVKAIEVSGRGQRQRAYLSFEKESVFLEPFKRRAESGKIASVLEIHRALEKHLGKTVHSSTVYRLLKRHGWRKIVPRPMHVRANAKAQEAFKKTSTLPSKKY